MKPVASDRRLTSLIVLASCLFCGLVLGGAWLLRSTGRALPISEGDLASLPHAHLFDAYSAAAIRTDLEVIRKRQLSRNRIELTYEYLPPAAGDFRCLSSVVTADEKELDAWFKQAAVDAAGRLGLPPPPYDEGDYAPGFELNEHQLALYFSTPSRRGFILVVRESQRVFTLAAANFPELMAQEMGELADAALAQFRQAR